MASVRIRNSRALRNTFHQGLTYESRVTTLQEYFRRSIKQLRFLLPPKSRVSSKIIDSYINHSYLPLHACHQKQTRRAVKESVVRFGFADDVRIGGRKAMMSALYSADNSHCVQCCAHMVRWGDSKTHQRIDGDMWVLSSVSVSFRRREHARSDNCVVRLSQVEECALGECFHTRRRLRIRREFLEH